MSDFSNRDIDATVHQFETALSARHIHIPELKLARVLIALDRSNQDRAVLDFAKVIAERFQARLIVTYAADQGAVSSPDPEYAGQRAAELNGAGYPAEAVTADATGRAFQAILQAGQRHGSGLTIFPSPYNEDYRDLGTGSVGTTTDMLLHRRTGPLAVVRKPAENVRQQLEDVFVPLAFVSHNAEQVAAWAIALAPKDGMINLIGSGSESRREDNDHAFGASPESRLVAGFVGAVQERAAELGINCRVIAAEGEPASAALAVANAQPCVVVLGCEEDYARSDYQGVLALIRGSKNPVLVA